MSIILSHPTGNANVRAALRGLSKRGLLREFHTTIAMPSSSLPFKTLLEKTEFRRRQFGETPWHQIHLHPAREILRQIAPKIGLTILTRHETGVASVDAVYQHLDRAVAARLSRRPESFKAVYAYEDGALQSFEAAKRSAVPSVYELPIAHWRTLHGILNEEAEMRPEWSPTLGGLNDSIEKRERKDREIEAADKIIVPSSFVKHSLVKAFGDKEKNIAVVPFGSPPPLTAQPAERIAGQPLQLFFAGQLTQRKGLAYLAEALDRLEIDWRLTIAGPKPAETPKALEKFLALEQCTWLGRIPHAELLVRMSQAHVFVFPSLVEGFALVIPEAISAGLPIIATPNAGADILTDAKDSFIVPIRCSEAIADAITKLADDETLRRQMAMQALETAARSPWSVYEDEVANLVREIMGP